ncbi:hypothetical protein [Bacillus bombysepticus]|uniref:hypothetical protein n=1 Tax=Bacillus bombysepticus TaxID=658666 RepID=UPI003016C793
MKNNIEKIEERKRMGGNIDVDYVGDELVLLISYALQAFNKLKAEKRENEPLIKLNNRIVAKPQVNHSQELISKKIKGHKNPK